MSISQLFDRQPGPRLEFHPELNPDLILDTIVAFANTEGGQIVVGADELGRVTRGMQVEDADGLVRMALMDVRPPILIEVDTHEKLQGTVLVIKTPRSGELHTLVDGRVLVRRSTENVLLTGKELTLAATGRASSLFEEEEVAGTSIDDFDTEVVAEYIERRRERQPRAFVGSTETLLRQIGALTETGAATVFGMLLFGQDPQLFMPQCGLTFVKFAGSGRRGEQGQIGYGRREDISGPLARIVERAWRVVREEMKKQSVVRELQREDETEYPLVAVREALINAVAHRDYRIKGRRTEMLMFGDRLEITSPGGLPGYITVQNIVDEHYSRNPRVVNGLMQWGYIEELGLGVDKMIEAMVADGHPPPEFKASPHAFTVTLRKGREVGEPGLMRQWEHDMNERQMQALQWVQGNGRINNSDYRQLCPHVSAETLRLDLADLVDKGVLLKIGEKRGTYYVLKRRGGG